MRRLFVSFFFFPFHPTHATEAKYNGISILMVPRSLQCSLNMPLQTHGHELAAVICGLTTG